jgi:UDP-N-acetylmuramoylalanine--D-glutamate ligase
MKLVDLCKKNVAIWGYGVEGRATTEYLQQNCPELKFTVLCPVNEVSKTTEDELLQKSWRFCHDEVTTALLNQFDVVVKSPGISPYTFPAKSAKCQFISSSSLWFDNEKSGQVIAITGTKGKSTSCALLSHVLQQLGFNVVLAGNFGVPLISCTGLCDFVVLETSSYQAQDGAITADIAVLLNLYSEHLNWHITEAQYHTDKMRLLNRAKTVVVNANDENIRQQLSRTGLVEVIKFNEQHGFYALNHVLMYQDKALMSEYGWQLKGMHNLVNAAAVATVINCLNLDIKRAINAFKTFQPLPHRLQTLGLFKGVEYINDSIASTPYATLAALHTVDATQTILLVGGFDRGVDWDWWMAEIAAKPPKMIICSGANGKKIHQLILNHEIKTQSIWQLTLKEAVKTAVNLAKAGEVVLLSPGAPSFDAFDNYQHRGQKFAQWIK